MMSHRRRRHHKPPSNQSSANRLHHTGTGTGTGTAAEEEPMMIHSHRDDDDRMRRPIARLQPNVIARLMGIDDAAAVPAPKPAAGGIVQFQAQRRQTNKCSLMPYYSYRGGNDDAGYSGPSSRLCLNRMMVMVNGSGWRRRPRRHRRHPQEEELLQKMRQDLRAWQASMAPAALLQTASSSSCGRPSSDYSHDGGRSSLVLQAIAQEDLRRHKMARYRLAFGLGHSKVTRHDELLPLIKNMNKKKNGSVVAQGECDPSSSEHDHEDAAAEPAAAMPDDTVVVISPSTSSPRAAAAAPTAQAQELPSHRHTPIVLLKPTTCSESDTKGGVAIGGGQKTKTVLFGLPKLHRDTNMSMLLQEVKDRVQRELTLTAATTTRGELIKTPASAWTIPPPSQQVTKEDRGNKRLFRSKSFRAFRRDRKRNAGTAAATTQHASPETYILESETAVSPEIADKEWVTDASLPSLLRPGVVGVTDDDRSFRSEYLTTKHTDDDAPASPRPLFRSFSAPESGFSSSLGRLFSSKQHEASEPAAAAAVTVTSKNVVSAGLSFIRGTVSSLRHGFSSRRNSPFRRKTHWSNKASLAEIHPAKMEMPVCAATPPSHETFSLFKVAQANLSELPPSPVSPLEVAASHGSRHFLTDLHFTLPELSPKCLLEFEPPAGTSESSFRTDITAVEATCSRDKAYITELLIAAGLYLDDDGSSSDNKASACRVDSMARPMPICDDVFEDVEDMYYYRGDYIVGGGMYDGTDHRMLFDIANEALQSLVVESSRGGSSLRGWVVDTTGVTVSRGKKLVDDVWQQVQALRNPQQAQEMQTIDGMVAYEVRRSVWAAELLYEDVYVVGRKIERAIFDELIEDFLAYAGGFSYDETTDL